MTDMLEPARFDEITLHKYAEDAYLDYAVAVVKDRALGQVQDGLKPVQRRILYAMRELGLRSDAKPVKSARITGEVLGKFHPHGDSAAYDAMVRMAQDFSLRYPLVTGQGNYGSRDGDPAAAMRYCFVAGTRVSTVRGWVPIEAMVSATVREQLKNAGPGSAAVIDEVVDTSKGQGRAVRFVYSGLQDVVEVRTRNGHRVRCTPNEPFLVLTQELEFAWRDAQHLKPGDRVCMRRDRTVRPQGGALLTDNIPDSLPRNTRIYKLPARMSEDLALLLGLLVSDGCLRDATHELMFASACPQTLQTFVAAFERVFPDAPYELREPTPTENGFKTANLNFEFRCASRLIRDFLNGVGLSCERSADKRVPRAVWEGSSAEIAAFLRGYFEGDGSVSCPQGQEVQLTAISKSPRLLEDIKTLLLTEFGIITSKLYTDRECWRIRVSGLDNVVRFGTDIGFVSTRKQSRLPTQYVKTGGPSRTDVVPHVTQALKELRTDRRVGPRHLANEQGVAVLDCEAVPVALSRLRAKEAGAVYGALRKGLPLLAQSYPRFARQLEEIAERNYFYAEIEDVRPAGTEAVYDLTVEGTHAFVAEGFVVHNTEARLSPIAQLLLQELGAETVDFAPNYDNTLLEPVLLPARLPFMLLNGTMGIAVGMASNVPPHNLVEVARAASLVVRNPDATDAEILEVLPGPDFPDGGQLVSSAAEIAAAYASGRGSMRLRARWEREDMARGQWQIVVTQLPYQVSTRKVLEELEALTNPQPPAGKKTITPQQATLKAASLEFLERAVDESDKDQPTRLVLHPRSSKVDADAMMAFLLANTSLETNVSLNMTMIGLDGRPQVKSLRQVLVEWGQFRVTTVRRRTAYELKQAEGRIHVLEGRMTVFLNLDAVIKVIREADDPKAQLQSQFSLSEIQTEDILEMRLRALNKLEGLKIERELEELRKLAERLKKLLASEPLLRKLVVEEIEADATKYGDERRTLIKSEAKAASGTAAAIAKAATDEPVTVVLSKNYFIKAYKGHDVSLDQLSFKPGDELLALVKTRTTWPVLLLDSLGRAYTVDAASLPSGRGEGVPVTTLVEVQPGARIVHAMGGHPASRFLFAGENGYGFVAKLENLVATRRAGKAFLTLDASEAPMAPVALPETDAGLLVAGSSDGRLLAFPPGEVKALAGGGKGVMLMVLEDGQKLVALRHQEAQDTFEGSVDIKGTATPVAFAAEEFKKYIGRRARKGCQLPKKGTMLA